VCVLCVFVCFFGKISPDGEVTTIAGHPKFKGANDGVIEGATFNAPTGVDIHPRDGSIVVADKGNHRIRHITYGDPRKSSPAKEIRQLQIRAAPNILMTRRRRSKKLEDILFKVAKVQGPAPDSATGTDDPDDAAMYNFYRYEFPKR